jgi:CHAT domain-containing protein
VFARAQTLIMSLWKVPDKQTKELMRELYMRFVKGFSNSEKLRLAQLVMREGYADPFYWGAFVCHWYTPAEETNKLQSHQEST